MPNARGFLYLFLVLFTYHNTIAGQLPPDRGEDCGEEYNQCYKDCAAGCANQFNSDAVDLALDYNLYMLLCEDHQFGYVTDDAYYFGYPLGENGDCSYNANNWRRIQQITMSNSYTHCLEQYCGQLCYYRDIYIYSCPD